MPGPVYSGGAVTHMSEGVDGRARTGVVACRSFYTHPPPTYTPHYPLQLPLTPPGSSQHIPYPEIPLEIPLAPGLAPMRREVAARPPIGPAET